MARPLRIEYPGAFYHITSRGNERKNIFKSKRDREKFLGYLESAFLRYDAVIHSYCLMDNHYHLLLETPSGNLSQIMRHINGAYTAYFNAKRRRAGHLFQGRYKSILVDMDEYGKELSRYIHLNPVRANMVELPEDYEWSSYPYFTGKKKPPDWLYGKFILEYFGEKISTAQKRYRKFVENISEKKYKSPLAEIVSSTLLGPPDFIKFIQEQYLSGMKPDENVPALKELKKKATLDQIFTEVESVFSKNEPAVARNVKMYLSRKYSGRSLKEISLHFGIGASGVSQSSRRVSERMKKDRKLKKRIQKIEAKLNLSRMKT
ncbi:MAG: transposase [Deltaproteobacteria bacterium]|nr:transposase [Deltaproteobacteria bacterium]